MKVRYESMVPVRYISRKSYAGFFSFCNCWMAGRDARSCRSKILGSEIAARMAFRERAALSVDEVTDKADNSRLYNSLDISYWPQEETVTCLSPFRP